MHERIGYSLITTITLRAQRIDYAVPYMKTKKNISSSTEAEAW